jgi:hypothetical protein
MRRRFSVRQTTPRRRTSCPNTMTELEPAVILDLAEAGFEYAKHGTKSERLFGQPRALLRPANLGSSSPSTVRSPGDRARGQWSVLKPLLRVGSGAADACQRFELARRVRGVAPWIKPPVSMAEFVTGSASSPTPDRSARQGPLPQ